MAIDAKRGRTNWLNVYINGGRLIRKRRFGVGFEVEELGAGEILLTSIDFDGTKEGYDIELTRKVSR